LLAPRADKGWDAKTIFMKNKTTVIRKIQRGSMVSLAVLAAVKLTSVNALAENIEVNSDLPSALTKSARLSHVEPSKVMNVVFVLGLKDPNGASEFARRVSTPDDPLYGKFLTPEQFGVAYGPSDSDYEAVLAWVTKNGLSLNEINRSHTTLSVRGTVAQFETLFGTRIDNYRGLDGRSFFSAGTAPSISAEIASRLGGVIGLSNYAGLVPMVLQKPANVTAAENGIRTDSAGGSGPGGAYSASDLRSAYSIPAHLSPQKTQTVAVFEQGGFAESDIKKYETENGLPDVPVTVHKVNGYGGGIDDKTVELEAVLDIDMVIGINPNVQEVQVYEDGDDPFGVALLDALAAMANNNVAQTISISYGTDEAIQGTTQIAAEGVLFQQLAAQGQSVFVSAGDQGAYGRSGNGLNVSDPGSQTNVTCVGGTTLYTGPGSAYITEETWNLLSAGFGATGGGASTYWAIPEWQVRTLYPHGPGGGLVSQTVAMPDTVATKNGGSDTMRNIPDVAAVANPLTGVSVYSAINGGWQQVGGTSASTPIWAGYLSIIDAARQIVGLGRFGLINPDLYFLAYTAPGLIDVQDGSNGDAAIYGIPGYNAGPGYDDCTGWGSMLGETFAFSSLTRHLVITRLLPDTPRGFGGTAGKTTAKLFWAKTPRAKGYIIQAQRTDTGALTNYIASGTNIELTDLAPKTTYLLALVAVNKEGANLVPGTPLYITTL
jgi:subtilase family serine protease